MGTHGAVLFPAKASSRQCLTAWQCLTVHRVFYKNAALRTSFWQLLPSSISTGMPSSLQCPMSLHSFCWESKLEGKKKNNWDKKENSARGVFPQTGCVRQSFEQCEYRLCNFWIGQAIIRVCFFPWLNLFISQFYKYSGKILGPACGIYLIRFGVLPVWSDDVWCQCFPR